MSSENNVRNVPFNTLIKTVDISLRMIPEDAEIDPHEGEEESSFEPFNYPLPIPPNCKLFHTSESKESKLPITEDIEKVEVKEKVERELPTSLPPLNCNILKNLIF